MRKAMVLVLTIFVLSGCTTMGTQFDRVRERNRARLIQLNLGMNKATILDIMGNFTDTLVTRSRRDGAAPLAPITRYVNNPYRTSAFKRESSHIEVLYYYTDKKSADGGITDDELTPIVLIDGKLAGWGWDYWNDVAYKYEIRIR